MDFLAKEQMGLPPALADMLMVGIKAQVFGKTGMKVDDLKPVNYAPNCKVPAFFIHGVDDNLIGMFHTE